MTQFSVLKTRLGGLARALFAALVILVAPSAPPQAQPGKGNTLPFG